MRSKMWRLPHYIFILITLSVFILAGCNGEKESEPSNVNLDGPPPLPPKKSLMIDMNQFKLSEKSVAAMSVETAALKPGSYYNRALAHIAHWTAAEVVHLGIPTLAFVAAFGKTPVKQADGSYLWAYNATIFNQTYRVKLFGKFTLTNIHWELYLTVDGEFADFKWITGDVSTNLTKGTYQIYGEPESLNSVQLFQIDWQADPDADTIETTISYVKPEAEGTGSFASFGVSDDEQYPLFYEIFGNNVFVAEVGTYMDYNVIIEYNPATREGRIDDPVAFDEGWHYWDSDLQNVE